MDHRGAERANHPLMHRVVGGEQKPARLGEPAPQVRMEPARRAALELIQRHDRVLRSCDASGERRLEGDVRRQHLGSLARAGRSVRVAVAIDQHVEIDDAAFIAVRSAA